MIKFAGDWRYQDGALLCSVAVAIVGAGALSAGASMFGANEAANAQEQASQNATNAQMSMFNTAQGELQPYINMGQQAGTQLLSLLNPSNTSSALSSLLKLTTPGADMTSTLEQTPGFQFANTYGQKAVRNALAARGLGGPGGPLAKASAQYAEGLAGNTWSSVVNGLLSAFGAQTTPLQNLTSTGSGAASSLGTAATNTGSQIGSNMIGAGNAAAGADIASANAIGGIGNSVTSGLLLNQLMANNASNGGLYGGNTGGTGGLLGGLF